LAALEDAMECSSLLDPFASFSDLPFGRPNEWSFGLSLSQNLFAGGRILAQNRMAGANRRSAETELTAQQAQLLLDVTTAYYDAALSDRLLSIAEASLEQAERTLQDVRVARQAGTQPEFDLLRAEVTRDNQKPLVILRRTSRELAYVRLAQALNLPLDEPLLLTIGVGGLMKFLGLHLDKLIKLKPGRGVRIKGDDFLLNPTALLPPPATEGRVGSVEVSDSEVVLGFQPQRGEVPPPWPFPIARPANYVYYRGGVLRFGKLTMHDADLFIVDASPEDPFDFFLQRYVRQLVAGTSRTTPDLGLIVVMPDYRKLPLVSKGRKEGKARKTGR
jgi:Outer membrane efflux protein